MIARVTQIALALELIACAEPASCAPADLSPLASPPAFAFVASDYASSAIGLLDEDGQLVREAWLDSGTVAPSVVTALSGDVVLGSTPLAPCVLTVVDRRGTDVVTFLDVCARDSVVRGQLDVGASFHANPQDVIPVDDTLALVSRYAPNRAPDAAELDRGNDLLVIDWRAPSVLSRVDLSALDADVNGEIAYARPGRMALLTNGSARRVVIGLARLTSDFQVAGPGAIGVLDLDTMEARAVSLSGLANCGELDAAPGSASVAIVTCAGVPFAPPDDRRAGAGVASIELDAGGEVTVKSAWRAVDHPSSPVFDAWSVPISAERVVTIAMGDLRASLNDRAGAIELDHEASPILMEAGSAFVLGDGAFAAQSRLLLVPDADRGGVRRFRVDLDGTIRELDLAPTSGCRGLPPREVRAIAAP